MARIDQYGSDSEIETGESKVKPKTRAVPRRKTGSVAQPQMERQTTYSSGEWMAHGSSAAISPQRRGRGTALGWFSLGLGLAQLVAPKQVARLIGLDGDDEATCLALRMIGGRELVCGVGLLSQSHPSNWMWGRVAGDVLDLTLLGKALLTDDTRNDRLLTAGAAVLGVTCADAYMASRLHKGQGDVALEGLEVRESVTIARPPEEVYAFFRDFQNLPRFMSHLESVRVDNGHSHWRARGPLGTRVEWDAEIIEDRPNELIVWRSIPNADIANQGQVQFRRLGERDTELKVVLRYDPPVGKVGDAIASLLGKAPSQQISADLRRLKQVLETGEVLHSDASIHRGMHAAQPSELSALVSKQVRS